MFSARSDSFEALPANSRLPVSKQKRPCSPTSSKWTPLPPASPIFYPESPLRLSSPSVSDIVKQRVLSSPRSPSKVSKRTVFGIGTGVGSGSGCSAAYSAGSSAAYSATNASTSQSSRRLSLGTTSKLNSYGQSTSLSKRRNSLGNSNSSTSKLERIKVCVRKRPLNERENHDILECNEFGSTVAVLEERVKLDGISRYIDRHEFRFDRVFDVQASNYEIYEAVVQDLIETVVQGGRATCFAYGQTGSGKTHTMLNAGDGLYHLAAADLMRSVLHELPDVSIHVAFYEIYQNSLYDLLNQKRKLMACEGKGGEVHIVGLTEIPVSSVSQLQSVMHDAMTTRSTGSTAANSTSSRSHAILQFILKRRGCHQIYGKFSFIDLAGSERGSDRANVDKQTKLEGAEINKSLLALKECIRAIDQDSSHLPFRQSRLTLVLKDSFVGDAKTCMIATVSPAAANCEHTINTLRYADRVKELKGPSGCGSEEVVSFASRLSSPLKQADSPFKRPQAESSLKADSPLKKLQAESSFKADALLKRTVFDSPLKQSYAPSPTKMTPIQMSTDLMDLELDESLLKDSRNIDPALVSKKRDKLHQAIAVLYDRVSSSKDLDLIELLQEEVDTLLSAIPK